MADVSTFSTLYRRYQRVVSRALVHHGVLPGDVDDAVQEVFLVLLRKIEGCVDEQRLEAWLFEVSRRVASNHRRAQLRRLRKRTNLWRDPSQPGADASVLQRECLAKFEGFVGELEPLTAKVFVLAAVEGLRAAEIAARLDVPPHKVYPRLRSAKTMFAARLEAGDEQRLRALVPGWMRGWMQGWGRLLVRHAAAVLPAAMLLLVGPMPALEAEPSMRSTQRSVAASSPAIDGPARVPDVPEIWASHVVLGAAVMREAPTASHRPAPGVDLPSRSAAEQATVEVRGKGLGPRPPASNPRPLPAAQPTTALATPGPTSASAPADDAFLRGRVIDSHGHALEGATVYCQHRVGLRRHPCSRSATKTDADGHFELPTADAGTYRLLAIAPGSNTSAGPETFVDVASLGGAGPQRAKHLTLVAD